MGKWAVLEKKNGAYVTPKTKKILAAFTVKIK